MYMFSDNAANLQVVFSLVLFMRVLNFVGTLQPRQRLCHLFVTQFLDSLHTVRYLLLSLLFRCFKLLVRFVEGVAHVLALVTDARTILKAVTAEEIFIVEI